MHNHPLAHLIETTYLRNKPPLCHISTLAGAISLFFQFPNYFLVGKMSGSCLLFPIPSLHHQPELKSSLKDVLSQPGC